MVEDPDIPSGALLSLLLVEDPPLVEMEDLPPLLVDGFSAAGVGAVATCGAYLSISSLSINYM
jgi:hypothetical protein